MSTNDPPPPPKSQRLRFSDITRSISPDRIYSGSYSANSDSGAEDSLLPQPVGWHRSRRGHKGVWNVSRGNVGLFAVLVFLSILFGTIVWENSEGCELSFHLEAAVALRLVRRVQEVKEMFLLDQYQVLQHGIFVGGEFCNVLSDPLIDNSELLVTAKNGVVSSDVDVCSQIGINAMKEGGNAVDAAIATAVCIGTINMFASGVGGGGFMVVRMADGTAKSFNFREMAPANASREMFDEDPKLAQEGGLAVAVPGEVHGFASAHQMFGVLPWKDIWDPSIKLNSEGFHVTPTLERIMLKEEQFFYDNRQDWPFLFSGDSLVTAGDVVKRPAYAETLSRISGGSTGDAYAGVKDFYNGTLAARLSTVIQAANGIVSESDFSKYYTIVSDAVNTTFMDNDVFTCPPPCSGPVLLEGLNIAEGLPMNDPNDPDSHHYLIEAMKWLSAGRTELGDPSDTIVANNALRIAELTTKKYAESVRANVSAAHTYPWQHYKPAYEPNDPKGTSHLSVVDKDGNAVALTSTINLYWGAKLHDPVSGVVLNSQMDDFSIPGRPNAYHLEPSIYNYIRPFKRPLSSTSPTVIADSNGAKMVIGGSGGSRIVTGVFQAVIKRLVWGYNLLDTIRSPRLHHQLIPEVVFAEEGIEDRVIRELERKGHVVERKKKGEAAGGSVLQGVCRDGETGVVQGVADWWRKGGKARGY